MRRHTYGEPAVSVTQTVPMRPRASGEEKPPKLRKPPAAFRCVGQSHVPVEPKAEDRAAERRPDRPRNGAHKA
ncbi:hypothetical protein LMG27198_23580 [Methylocystis echinoides]|uniref:Uncharacterized protein n=1 Tax=Methylocystis echinoides TaxID=29468 RepID=A0A9W6LSE3_9HYPH|nr:hypothetical protein LMG27198_23580 [Methylocystis echinoides]